jgi:phenylacetate-coenzyme A ligase PaaK-like adenylate-forming protein
VQTTGEILTEAVRKRLVAAWGENILDIYGSTEAGLVGAECPQQRRMHLVDTLYIAEVVDEDNRPVPLDEFGEKVLLTVLFRQTQPLIRYELSDRIRLSSQRCPCGSSYQVIDGIQGRSWETLYLEGRNGEQVAVQPLVFDYVMEGIPADWQVVQEPNRLRVLLTNVRGALDEGSLLDELRSKVEEAGAILPPTSLERVQAIPRTSGGKAPLVRSLLSGPENAG